MATETIVRGATMDKGLDPEDKAVRKQLNESFPWAMHLMSVAGTVLKVGHWFGARWELTE
jgi:hypothetical protein